MEPSRADRDLLERLEEELWREETRFDRRRMEELLAPDFFEFGRSGRIYQRAETLAVPRQPIAAVIPLPNFSVRLIAPDVAQVTYDSELLDAGVVQRGHRSSLWTRSARGWQLRFHQGTVIPP
jgi:hypothetical protein